jgi:hypothetical protein
MTLTDYTGACLGYVVDHVIPLKRGGPDTTGICNGGQMVSADGGGAAQKAAH